MPDVRTVPHGETETEEPPPAEPPDPVYDEEFALAWAEADDVQVVAGVEAFLIVWIDRSAGIRGRFFSVADRVPIGSSFLISDQTSTGARRVGVSAGPDDEFLVVWSSSYSIRAAKVSLHGGVSASTQVASSGHWWSPNVGWTGDAWLVTWASSIDIGDTGYAIVRGIRLDANVAPLDAEPFRLCQWNYANEAFVVRSESGVVLVCAGEEHWNTWTTLWGSAGHESAPVAVNRSLPESAASNGSQVLVTFTDDTPTESIEIDAETQAAGPPTVLAGKIPEGPYRQHSAAVWGGSRWLIAREEPGVLEPDVFLDDVQMFTSAWAPRIAESGGLVLVVAVRDGEIVARAFENGAPLAADARSPVVLSPLREMDDPILDLGAEQHAGHAPEACNSASYYEGGAVAVAAGKALIAWSVNTQTLKEVRFRIVDASGATTPDVLLDAKDATHYVRGIPVVASNGSEFLVGWFSSAGYTPYFNVARVSADGVVRDPGGIHLGSNTHETQAALVWHQDHWIAVWRGDRSVYMRRLAANGTPIDAAPVFLGEAWWPSTVQAVSNGRTSLVTWSDGAIRGVLFGESNGYQQIPPIASSPQYLAATASGTDGENYLVAYSCNFGCPEDGRQSAILQQRTWSIEIDGLSGTRIEAAPQPVSRLHPRAWRISDTASIAHGSDWWVLRMETTDPYVDWPVSDVYLGDERIFEGADTPMIARDGSFVIAAARRAHEVVYRIGQVVEE